jgi:hypothetical protein
MIDVDEELIRPIAYRIGNRYRQYVEREDVAQELRLWWLTHPKAVERYTDDGKVGEKKLTKSLYRAAEKFAREQKALALGYKPEDEFFYNTELIRMLLPMVWNPELIFQEVQPDDLGGKIRRSKAANEGNNLPAMVADVAQALHRIDLDDYKLLLLHFALQYEYKELAEELDINVGAAKMRVQRAIERLVETLGGETPWTDGPGSRRAISNAHAAAITANQEDG